MHAYMQYVYEAENFLCQLENTCIGVPESFLNVRLDDGRPMTHFLTVESFEHEELPMHELNRKINLIWFDDLPTFSKAWGTALANWVEMNRQNDIKNMFTFGHSGWRFCPKSSITSPPNKKNSTVMNEFILAPKRIAKLQKRKLTINITLYKDPKIYQLKCPLSLPRLFLLRCVC